jgi:hypothetical protein
LQGGLSLLAAASLDVGAGLYAGRLGFFDGDADVFLGAGVGQWAGA